MAENIVSDRQFISQMQSELEGVHHQVQRLSLQITGLLAISQNSQIEAELLEAVEYDAVVASSELTNVLRSVAEHTHGRKISGLMGYPFFHGRGAPTKDNQQPNDGEPQ